MKQWMKANQTALLLSGSILVSATGLGALREYGNSQQLMVAEAKLSAAQSSLALNEAENAARKADGASALRDARQFRRVRKNPTEKQQERFLLQGQRQWRLVPKPQQLVQKLRLKVPLPPPTWNRFLIYRGKRLWKRMHDEASGGASACTEIVWRQI